MLQEFSLELEKIDSLFGIVDIKRIMEIQEEIALQKGFSTFPIMLPKKLLAVCSGLAQYGNNGLVYIKGMGSYFRLTAFATDFKNNNYTWIKPSLMDSCAHYGKCVENCPAKALKHGIPWVNIDKCITEFNEQEGDFPDWLHRDWHNCVIGCIKCQEVCPLNNKEWQTIIIPIEYSEVEELLNSKYFSDVSEHLKTILKSLDLDRYYTEIKRNINYLIKS
jgi:epoxyqueuosine reductase